MSKPLSKYQTVADPVVAITVGVVGEALIDCARLGATRMEHQRRCGADWPRRSKNWNVMRNLVRWLWSWQFANMAELLGIDDDMLRFQMLRWISGQASGTVHWQ